VKDLRLIIKVKNNRLVRARERLGLNQTQMADLCGVDHTKYGDIENLKWFPITKSGWSIQASKISSVVGICEEELFPEAFKKIKSSVVQREVSINELPGYERQLLESPDSVFETKELCSQLDKAMVGIDNGEHSVCGLTERERFVIDKRFGLTGDEMTREDVGQLLYVTPERVQIIEKKALSKLRYPTRAKLLMSFADW